MSGSYQWCARVLAAIALALCGPALALAQSDVASSAMVEGNPTDITTWAYAARVPVGGTVTWTNLGAEAHTVTADNGAFDSGEVAPGAAAALKFDVPGLFAYVCTRHPSMKGYILVASDAANAGPSMAMVERNAADDKTWGFAQTVQAGEPVTWANAGAQGHTATTTDFALDTGLISPGAAGSLTFDTPGVVPYLCTPHPWMRGILVVNRPAQDLAITR